MTYIDDSHATWLRSKRYVGSFVIIIFGTEVYYNSTLQSKVSTRSTEAEFMASVYGSKSAKYIYSILEEMGFSRQGHKNYSMTKLQQ